MLTVEKTVEDQQILVAKVDLSEPPNGTTSGCPPPSHRHNYRTILHTQQRNRFHTCESDCFWMGVAQITRKRDRNLSVSHCSKKFFRLVPFAPRIVALAPVFPVLPFERIDSCRIEPQKRRIHGPAIVRPFAIENRHFSDETNAQWGAQGSIATINEAMARCY